MNIREQFAKARVMIVGDIVLDQYWWGTVDRISPEAPVPVVRLNETTLSPGGAANVAMNVAGLEAKAILVGCVGNDTEAQMLIEHLNSRSVDTARLVKLGTRPTSIKTRIVAHGQHVVRVDRESSQKLDRDTEDKLIEQLSDLHNCADLLIISDYAKGTLTERVLEAAIQLARSARIPVVVDPKGKNYSKYKGSSMITPNRREAADACGLDDNFEEVVAKAGGQLLEQFYLDAVVITEGERGITLFEKGQPPITFKAEAHEIYDVTGAGDTVIATLGVAIASGISRVEAVKLANTAAGLVVEQVGTTAISLDHLIEKLETRKSLPADDPAAAITA